MRHRVCMRFGWYGTAAFIPVLVVLSSFALGVTAATGIAAAAPVAANAPAAALKAVLSLSPTSTLTRRAVTANAAKATAARR